MSGYDVGHRSLATRRWSVGNNTVDTKAENAWIMFVGALQRLDPSGTFHDGYDVGIQDGEYETIVGHLDPISPKLVCNRDYQSNWYTKVVACLAGDTRYPGPLIIEGRLALFQYVPNKHRGPAKQWMMISMDDVARELDGLKPLLETERGLAFTYKIEKDDSQFPQLRILVTRATYQGT